MTTGLTGSCGCRCPASHTVSPGKGQNVSFPITGRSKTSYKLTIKGGDRGDEETIGTNPRIRPHTRLGEASPAWGHGECPFPEGGRGGTSPLHIKGNEWKILLRREHPCNQPRPFLPEAWASPGGKGRMGQKTSDCKGCRFGSSGPVTSLYRAMKYQRRPPVWAGDGGDKRVGGRVPW